MVELIANSPCAGLLPVEVDGFWLSEVDLGPVTLISPFRGKRKAVSEVLKANVGLGLPGTGRVLGNGPRMMWLGADQALLIGAACPDLTGPSDPLAACIDHSDAWAATQIEGPGVEDVLARLTPIDVRAQSFKRGHTARSLIGHMRASITRLGAQSFEIMVMRSMAQTLVHELTAAAEGLAGRRALRQ